MTTKSILFSQKSSEPARKKRKFSDSRSVFSDPVDCTEDGYEVLQPSTSTIPTMPKLRPVSRALAALNATRVLRINEESKTPSAFYVYPPELVLALKGMLGAGKVYRFCMNETTGGTGLTSSGAGLMDQAYSWSPNSRTYGEWSALAALFDQVKAHRVTLTLTSTFSGSSASATIALLIAPDYLNNGVTPTGALVSRLPGCRQLSVMHTDSYVIKANIDRAQPWRVFAITSSPDATSPCGGTVGQWSVSSIAGGANSVKYFESKQRLICSFTNRA